MKPLADWWEAIGGAALFGLVLAWIARRTIGRVDKLEQGKADQEALSQVMAKMDRYHEEDRVARKEIYTKLGDLQRTQNEFNLTITRELGKLQGQRGA